MSMKRPQVHRIYVEESILGVFGINETNEIVERTLYPPDPKQIAAALSRQQDGEVTREVEETVEKLIQRGFNRFVFTNKALAEAVARRWDVEVEVSTVTDAANFVRENLEKLAADLGVAEDASQLHALSHEVSVLMARRAVGRALSEREALINRTVQAIGELDKTLNALSSKLREWYGVHFPELNRLVEDHRTYAKIVGALGDRGSFTPEALSDAGLPRAKAERVAEAARGSMGAPLGPEDLAPVRRLSEHLLALYGYRRSLEEYLSDLAKEVAPNLSEVAGPMLAARLIEKAGGLRKLSMMPASTIQLLGAEKAMFRALRSGARPPKHGLIFQHPVVHNAPRRMRGRAARSLAAKLAIAARADAFSGKSIGAQLRRELDSKMERVRRKNSHK
ncbi:C/D box methylation guide ribonucleoprotein complex aNOP56 subunit [Candidatus Bathyarchaeota archaeon]|nr:MAG: C/D box methylation guide ribonucleoprotein complex aNOP56 subunit [Candidatus Bathyarchaeota archaeon]